MTVAKKSEARAASKASRKPEEEATADDEGMPTTNELPTGRNEEEAYAARSGVSRDERQCPE